MLKMQKGTRQESEHCMVIPQEPGSIEQSWGLKEVYEVMEINVPRTGLESLEKQQLEPLLAALESISWPASENLLLLPAFFQLSASSKQCGEVVPSEGKEHWFAALFI
jgi:hypothetical protein